MDLTVLMAEHDSALKTSIASLIARRLGDTTARELDADLKAIFKKEHDEWQAKVVLILGKDRAHEVFARMKETV